MGCTRVPLRPSIHGIREKIPHGRASYSRGHCWCSLSLFPGELGGQESSSPALAPGSKPAECQASHVTSLDLSILICEIASRFMISESQPASTFHIPYALSKYPKFYGNPPSPADYNGTMSCVSEVCDPET